MDLIADPGFIRLNPLKTDRKRIPFRSLDIGGNKSKTTFTAEASVQNPWRVWRYLIVAITPRSALTWSGSTSEGLKDGFSFFVLMAFQISLVIKCQNNPCRSTE